MSNFHARYAIRRVLFNDYSQSGETRVLRRLFDEATPKILVNVGANDGISVSNSYEFIKEGWRGLLIEPNSTVFAKLEKNIASCPHAKPLKLACSNSTGESPLYFACNDHKGMLSSLDNKGFWLKPGASGQSEMVTVKTLTEVLTEENIPSDFALLLIDAEGMDLEILQGLDFKRFAPRVIVTESVLSDEEAQKNSRKAELLLSHSYVFVTSCGRNTIWRRVHDK